jgi:hypothetical protein
MLAIGKPTTCLVGLSEPDQLDLGRAPAGHVGFGHGHFCLGASLARVQTEVALTAVFDRFRAWPSPPRPTTCGPPTRHLAVGIAARHTLTREDSAGAKSHWRRRCVITW